MLDVTPYRQKAGLCGPSSLKMVLQYFGIEKTEKELAKLAGYTPGKGTTAKGIVAAAGKIGFKATIRDNSTIRQLANVINKRKIPAIVDWFSTDDGHYSVAVGVDKKYVYLQDPELGGIRKLPIAEFKRVWFDFPGDFLKSKKEIIIGRMIVVQKKN